MTEHDDGRSSMPPHMQSLSVFLSLLSRVSFIRTWKTAWLLRVWLLRRLMRKHSAYHFGAMSKILIRLMTSDIFGPVSPSGDHFLEGAMFGASPAYLRAKELILNDRPTARCIGGKDTMCIRVTPAVSKRIPDFHVSEIDYDNAFRTLAYTMCSLRSNVADGPFHADCLRPRRDARFCLSRR